MLQPSQATDNPFSTFWKQGFHRLVPVIPPNSRISEKSTIAVRMRAGEDPRGKVPGVKGSDGEWRGVRFTAIEAQESDLAAWNEMGASVGVKMGAGLIAVDVDTKDKRMARAVYELAAETLGAAPVRFGQRPKCLLLYRAPEDCGYRSVRFETDVDERAAVEVLTEGRQIVVHGEHPKTGEPYVWPQGLPHAEALTEITHEQLDAFMAKLEETLPEATTVRSKDDPDAPDPETLFAPSEDRLREIVEGIPNSSETFPSRDDYVRMAYAIKGAAQGFPDGEALAEELYLDWCARWEDGENDEGVAASDFARAKPPYRVGWEWLCEHAHRAFLKPVGADDALEAYLPPPSPAADDIAAKGGRIRLMSIADVMNLPDPEFLIDRHIPKDGFGILYGDPGSGKSFIALDMALHLAYGLDDWHGDEIKPKSDDRKGRVLYIAGEGAHGFRARIRAWQSANHEALGGRSADSFAFIFQPMNFLRQEDVSELLAAVANAGGDFDMIIVDTISRAIPGADENLQKDMTTFVSACDALRTTTGAFVLGVHHTAKAGGMRGSSVFLGQADVVFSLERKKGATVGKLVCEKQKDAPDGWHDSYKLSLVQTVEGTSSLVPERLGEEEVVNEDRVALTTQEKILNAMREAWDLGRPWSPFKQAREKWALRKIIRDFDVHGDTAEAMLGLWEQQRVIERATFGSRERVGYRVLDDDFQVGVFE